MKIFIVTGLFGLILINSVIGFDADFPLLWETKHMKNLTDFCLLLDMDLEECMHVLTEVEPVDGVDEDGEKMVVSGGVKSEIAMFDACNPRMSTIVIPRHPDNDITVWPTCTRAMRCGGCCTSDVFSCEPTETREKYVKVFDTRLPYVGAHRFQFLGVRAIKIIEHVHCDAQCKTKPHECHTYQKYESRKCRCVCRDERLSMMFSCKEGQIWDDSECDCICPNRNTVKCPEPSYFSTTTCKCTLKTEVTGEIDLDLLFAKLEEGEIDLDLNNLNGQPKIGNEGVQIGEETNKNIGTYSDDNKSSSSSAPETTSTASTTQSTTEAPTTTEATTTTEEPTTTAAPTPAPTDEPCPGVKCVGVWVPRKMANGRCLCLPPIG